MRQLKKPIGLTKIIGEAKAFNLEGMMCPVVIGKVLIGVKKGSSGFQRFTSLESSSPHLACPFGCQISTDKTVDDDAVGLAEFHDLAWIKATGEVDPSKPWMLEEMKDVA